MLSSQDDGGDGGGWKSQMEIINAGKIVNGIMAAYIM